MTTASAARPATSGSSATEGGPAGLEERSRRPAVPTAAARARAGALRSSPPPSQLGSEEAADDPARNIRAGLGRIAQPSARSSAATAWSPRNGGAAPSAIRASPPPRSWPPTICGAPISKANSKPATAPTAIRSRSPMATVASLLGCQALRSTSVAEAKPVFPRLFREFGLPQRIRTDNGVPFATNTLARLSQLSAWWVRLGVLPEFIEPGKPQQNGRHERMHRTLKAETTRPARRESAGSAAQVQHASARSSTTSAPMKRSTWKLPLTATPLAPTHAQQTAAARIPRSLRGALRQRQRRHPLEHDWVNVSTVCAGDYVGLEEIDDGVWNVYFGPLKLGRFLERHMRIEDAYGRLKRNQLNKCYRCLPTFLLPISPAAHTAIVPPSRLMRPRFPRPVEFHR